MHSATMKIQNSVTACLSELRGGGGNKIFFPGGEKKKKQKKKNIKK